MKLPNDGFTKHVAKKLPQRDSHGRFARKLPELQPKREFFKDRLKKIRRWDFPGGIIHGLIVAFPILLLTAGVYLAENDSARKWLSGLFALPVLIHVIACVFTHIERNRLQTGAEKKAIEEFCKFFNVTMILSVVMYCGPWITYSHVNSGDISPDSLSTLPYICLGFLVSQLCFVAFVTYVMMEATQKSEKTLYFFNTPSLIRGFELCVFWRFAHFFAIFMGISFVFGFAFAFHDLDFRKNPDRKSDTPSNTERAFENRALYVENLLSSEDPPETNGKEKLTKETVLRKSEEVSDGVTPVCIYFESGSAVFTDRGRSAELLKISGAKISDAEYRKNLTRSDQNFQEIDKILQRFEQNGEQDIPRLTLIGRADDKRIGVGYYPSNYELSEARINFVKSRIIDRLHTKNRILRNIDWILVPVSNEISDSMSDPLPSNDGKLPKSKCPDLSVDPGSGRRVVEAYFTWVTPDEAMKETTHMRKVLIEELQKRIYKTPGLIDYMYFSIYTITTTGYGDIKPATPYSKFLISLENFFEVFFIVCFMNTLISFKKTAKN